MRLVGLLACGIVSVAAGCIECRCDNSLLRVWADHNSLDRPALMFERLTHQPYKPERIDHFRWMYNRPVGRAATSHPVAGPVVVLHAAPPAVFDDALPADSGLEELPIEPPHRPADKHRPADQFENFVPPSPSRTVPSVPAEARTAAHSEPPTKPAVSVVEDSEWIPVVR